MIRFVIGKLLDSFSRRYGYDVAYLHELLKAERTGGLRLAWTMSFFTQNFRTSPDLFFAAKIRSTARADCGACLSLVMAMAEEAKIDKRVISAALGEDTASPELKLTLKFTDAVLDNDPSVPVLADQVLHRFGRNGRAALAVAISSGQFYPLLRRAHGESSACDIAHFGTSLPAECTPQSQPPPKEGR